MSKEKPFQFQKEKAFEFRKVVDVSGVESIVHLRWSDWDRRGGVATAADLIAALRAAAAEQRMAVLSEMPEHANRKEVLGLALEQMKNQDLLVQQLENRVKAAEQREKDAWESSEKEQAARLAAEQRKADAEQRLRVIVDSWERHQRGDINAEEFLGTIAEAQVALTRGHTSEPAPAATPARGAYVEKDEPRDLLESGFKALLNEGLGKERLGVAMRYFGNAVLAVVQRQEALAAPAATESQLVCPDCAGDGYTGWSWGSKDTCSRCGGDGKARPTESPAEVTHEQAREALIQLVDVEKAEHVSTLQRFLMQQEARQQQAERERVELTQRLARVAELAHDRNDDSHEWRSRRLGQCASVTWDALAAYRNKAGIDRAVVNWTPLAKQLADAERERDRLQARVAELELALGEANARLRLASESNDDACKGLSYAVTTAGLLELIDSAPSDTFENFYSYLVGTLRKTVDVLGYGTAEPQR